MKKTIQYLVIAGLMSTTLLLAESFVVVKKKKSVSASRLKEQCCDQFGEQLKLFACVLKEMGNVQEQGLKNTYELLDGDKENFFARAKKDDLQKKLKILQTFTVNLEEMHKEIKTYRLFLNSLKKA